MYSLGIEDYAFIRGNVHITKQEIRILTLAKAQLEPGSIVYDIGAGTGSLAIEAALRATSGHVYAIERNPEGVRLIYETAKKFRVGNLTVLQKEAPDGLEDLPPCDAVLVGGSGGRLPELLDAVDGKLRRGGRIVLNCITIQTIMQCINYVRRAEGYTYEAIQVQVSRLQQVGPYDMAKAYNPIYIVTCRKE